MVKAMVMKRLFLQQAPRPSVLDQPTSAAIRASVSIANSGLMTETVRIGDVDVPITAIKTLFHMASIR